MDLQAYLHRIGWPASPTGNKTFPNLDRSSIDLLRALHRAHLFTVPFENLDISLRREIICDEERILRKIVDEHRGGFCYELNGAFAALLRALGFHVTLLSARVAGEDDSYSPEFDHLTLRVDINRVDINNHIDNDLERAWLADVGFGRNYFLEPLRLGSRGEQPQNGRVHRLRSVPSEKDVLSLESMVEGK